MASKPKIVVVDDSRTQRTTISLALEQKGYEVVQGANGLEAISLVHHEDPDLLVSDIMMPELTGYQVCRLLKNDPATQDLPIILLTTMDHQQHRFWGKEAGADSYVLKAADSGPLQKEVARLLETKKRLPQEERPGKGPALPYQGAHARLTDLLDRLLFEATITNRIREIGRFGGEVMSSLQAFFEFFQGLIDYQISLLCLRTYNGPLMIVHLVGPVPAAFLELAKKTVMKERFLVLEENETIHEKILNPESLTQEEPAEKLHPAALSIPFSTALQEGGLAVFNATANRYTEETGHALKIAARELEAILKSNLQAEAMEKLKADFTAMTIHDLRSPLISVISVAAMMEDGLLGPITEEQKKWLGKVQGSARNLVDLVSDFLDLSKLEAGRLDLTKEEMDLGLLLQNSLENYSPLAREKKINLRNHFVSSLPKIYADPRRLEQVLSNLLSNALKFTSEGGAIEVGAGPENSAGVRIWVKDNGVGIPPDEIGQIFEKYRQAMSGKISEQKGTGLGLVICKMIVESHGGRIWVESNEGQGSTFFFSLPLGQKT
jgi:signal transduction histidine kinase/CheY-like chemotaxis protein